MATKNEKMVFTLLEFLIYLVLDYVASRENKHLARALSFLQDFVCTNSDQPTHLRILIRFFAGH